jgi:cytochrome c-type biogenesis protein CcmE
MAGDDTSSRDGGAEETTGPTNEEEVVANYEEKYTDPELREEIKEEIKASGKGGMEGQWSARKSQLLT